MNPKKLISLLLKSLSAMVKVLDQNKLSYSRFLLLQYIYEEGRQNMTLISKRTGHSTAAVTEMVDGLEKLRYVKRVPHPTDRRKTLVNITASGRSFLERVSENLLHDISGLVAQPA